MNYKETENVFVKLDLTNLGLNCFVIWDGPLFLSNRFVTRAVFEQEVLTGPRSCRLTLV